MNVNTANAGLQKWALGTRTSEDEIARQFLAHLSGGCGVLSYSLCVGLTNTQPYSLGSYTADNLRSVCFIHKVMFGKYRMYFA